MSPGDDGMMGTQKALSFFVVFFFRFLWRCFTMLSLFIQMFFGRVPTSFCKSLRWFVATVYSGYIFAPWLFGLEL